MPQANNHLTVQPDLFYPQTTISSQKRYQTLNEESHLAAIEACERRFFPFGKTEIPHKPYNISSFILQWIQLNVEDKNEKNNSIFAEFVVDFFTQARGKIRKAQIEYANLVATLLESKQIDKGSIDKIKGSSIDKLERLLEMTDAKGPVN